MSTSYSSSAANKKRDGRKGSRKGSRKSKRKRSQEEQEERSANFARFETDSMRNDDSIVITMKLPESRRRRSKDIWVGSGIADGVASTVNADSRTNFRSFGTDTRTGATSTESTDYSASCTESRDRRSRRGRNAAPFSPSKNRASSKGKSSPGNRALSRKSERGKPSERGKSERKSQRGKSERGKSSERGKPSERGSAEKRSKSVGADAQSGAPNTGSATPRTARRLSDKQFLYRDPMIESIRRVAERNSDNPKLDGSVKGSRTVKKRDSPAKVVAAQMALGVGNRRNSKDATAKKTTNKANKGSTPPADRKSKSAPPEGKRGTSKRNSLKRSGGGSTRDGTSHTKGGSQRNAIADLSDSVRRMPASSGTSQRRGSNAKKPTRKGSSSGGTALDAGSAATKRRTQKHVSERGSSLRSGDLLSALTGSIRSVARSFRSSLSGKSQKGTKGTILRFRRKYLGTFDEGGRRWQIVRATATDERPACTNEQKRRQRLVWRRLCDMRRDMVDEMSTVDPYGARLLDEMGGDESLDLKDEIFGDAKGAIASSASGSSICGGNGATLPEINIRDIRLGPTVGAGSFGVVVSGLWQGKPVAVKVRKSQPLMEDAAQYDEVFADETRILTLLSDSQRVVRLYGTTAVGGKPGLVMRLYPVTLGDLIDDRSRRSGAGGQCITPVTTHSYLCDIAEGLRDLHKRRIIFRDLKPENCLIDASNRLVLADFGISQEKSRDPPEEVGGTAHYMAPENFDEDLPLDPKSDIWSFASCLVHMWTGKPPWSDLPVGEVVGALATSRGRPKIPRDLPDLYHDMLRKCFKFKPRKRPSAQELLDSLLAYRIEAMVDSGSSVGSAGRSTSNGSRKKSRKSARRSARGGKSKREGKKASSSRRSRRRSVSSYSDYYSYSYSY